MNSRIIIYFVAGSTSNSIIYKVIRLLVWYDSYIISILVLAGNK